MNFEGANHTDAAATTTLPHTQPERIPDFVSSLPPGKHHHHHSHHHRGAGDGSSRRSAASVTGGRDGVGARISLPPIDGDDPLRPK